MNTTQSKHTPGPWHCDETERFIYSADGEKIASIERVEGSPDVSIVNAHLIAGSQELLAAASALSRAYLDAAPTKTKAEAWDRLHAAIRAAS